MKEKDRKIKVYVAGPMTIGDSAVNMRVAVDAAEDLLRHGFAPYVPHLTHIWQMFYQHSLHEWLELDFEWLNMCDALLRLPGESIGANHEVAKAGELSIPVFHDITTLRRYYAGPGEPRIVTEALMQNVWSKAVEQPGQDFCEKNFGI